MNLTIKKEWFDVIGTMEKSQQEEFYFILANYFFSGEEPEQSKEPAFLVFQLIKKDVDRDRTAKEKRRERQQKHQAKTKAQPRNDRPTTEKTPVKRFQKPTVEEVADYIKEKGYSNVNAKTFVTYYESVGWKVGRNPMKNWKATVTNWETRNVDSGNAKAKGTIWQDGQDVASKYENVLL